MGQGGTGRWDGMEEEGRDQRRWSNQSMCCWCGTFIFLRSACFSNEGTLCVCVMFVQKKKKKWCVKVRVGVWEL